MALKESEAIVLRTYPLREADLLVTLFTRLEGKVRGVARSAKKSRKRFGGALEPLTFVRAFYEDRERQELARLDAFEVLESPLASEVSYARPGAHRGIARRVVAGSRGQRRRFPVDAFGAEPAARAGNLDAGHIL